MEIKGIIKKIIKKVIKKSNKKSRSISGTFNMPKEDIPKSIEKEGWRHTTNGLHSREIYKIRTIKTKLISININQYQHQYQSPISIININQMEI